METTLKAHWEKVYATKASSEVSWYQPIPVLSLELIRATGVSPAAGILDVGGGTSNLVDHLLADGYSDLSVLDIASNALAQARARLGVAGSRVNWIQADVLNLRVERRYDVWHDRAVFHFILEPDARELYLETLRRALAPDGHVILATFGTGGPTRCSNLPVQRYSAEEVCALLGDDFLMESQHTEQHQTPWGSPQEFFYGRWRRVSA